MQTDSPFRTDASRPGAENILALAALAGLVVARLLTVKHAGRVPELCVFRRVTGMPCPSCGLTRATIAAAHGDFGSSVRLHPLGPVALLAMALLPLARVAGFTPVERYLRASSTPEGRGALLAATAILLLWSIGRVLRMPSDARDR